MPNKISIRSWEEPFPATEGVAVVFDVFRCSTTIYCLDNKDAGPLFVAPALKSFIAHPMLPEMRVFSELSQPVDCKIRFDNSPHSALQEPWTKEEPSLVATTTGTPAMFAARNFRKVYVGSLTNFSALIRELAALREDITLIPAAFSTSDHVEDEITAQAVATTLEGFSNIPDFVSQCAAQARERIIASGRPDFLSQKLQTGREDTSIALDIDRFQSVLSLEFLEPLLARVKREPR